MGKTGRRGHKRQADEITRLAITWAGKRFPGDRDAVAGELRRPPPSGMMPVTWG